MKQIAYTRALENACYYIHLNRTGTEGSTRFGGNSAIAAPDGTFIAQTESDQEIALTADMCDEEIMYARSTLAVYRDRRPDLYEILVAPLSSPI
jgi:predicted amidohydrolase